MFLFVVFLVMGLIAFLFCLYSLSKEDTIFIRKNISLENLFNFSFLAIIVGVFFARLFYVIFNFSPGFFNPLVFSLFTYYPGLSFSGGLLAATIFLFFFGQRRRMPLGHLFDFFGVALLIAMPFGYIATAFLASKIHYFAHVFLPILFICLFFFARNYVYPRAMRGELKTGTLGSICLIVISFISLLISIISNLDSGYFFLTPHDVLPLLLFVFSIIFFVKQEYFLSIVRK